MASSKAERSSHLGLYEDDFDEEDDFEEEDFEEEDEEDEETRALVKAAEDSVQMGSIAPLLKAELKAKIQLRRLQSGQEELVLEASQPTYQMTIEEIQKRNLKREKNRLSALRTRVKQKFHETELLQKIKRLEETHRQPTTEREKLQQKVLHKRQRLARHLQDCPLVCKDSQLRPSSPAAMGVCGSDSAVSLEVALGSDSNTSADEAAVDVPVTPHLSVAVQAERKNQPDDSHATGLL